MKKSRKALSFALSVLLSATCPTVFVSAAENVSAAKMRARKAYLEEIPRSFGGVEILDCSDLDIDDPNFWVEFYDPNHHSPAIDIENPNPDPYYIPYDQKLDLPQPLTTANTKYNVYTSSNSLKAQNVVSVFDAINKAQDLNDKVIETDTGTTVFINDGSESTFYAFQFTNFYKILYSAEAANNWVRDFAYAHVVNGTGRISHNSYRSLKGVPDTMALEANGGGYYYKYSYPTDVYIASSLSADFSNVQLKFNDDDRVVNAYVFSAITNNNGSIEFGIITSKKEGGIWYPYCMYDHNLRVYRNCKAAVPQSNSGGVYTYPAGSIVDIKICIKRDGRTDENGIKHDILYGTVFNRSTGASANTDEDPENCKFDLVYPTSGSKQFMFLHACSFVQEIKDNSDNDKNVTNDIRCGAYFKNVALCDCALFTDTAFSENKSAFYANSDVTSFAFLYNDDCITRSDASTSTKEIFSIDYSVGYQQ